MKISLYLVTQFYEISTKPFYSLERKFENFDYQISSDLISGLAEGDINSFKKIYTSFFNKVLHFVLHFSLTKEDAEEIVQDVFVKLWEKRATIDIDKNLSGFLYTIAKNLVIDKIRQYVATEKRIEKVNAKEMSVASSESTEQLVNFYELSGIISKLIDELPSRRRTIFKLSRENCLTYKEISNILKISQGTVEKQMSKALHTLKIVLKNKYGVFIDLIVLFPFLTII